MNVKNLLQTTLPKKKVQGDTESCMGQLRSRPLAWDVSTSVPTIPDFPVPCIP